MANDRRFVVLGGAGTIGKIVIRDLLESHTDNFILIADYKIEAAKSLADSFKTSRVQFAFANASEIENLSKLLHGGGNVVINCTQDRFNLSVMEAALLAGVHYVDLGGLFTWTHKQLRLNKRFREAGLTAVIGMGCAPGITNVLAAYAVSKLDQVESIKIRVGARDFNPPKNELYFPYSVETIINELTLEPWIFKYGKFRKIKPQTGWEETEFPDPVGKVWTLWTRHSEIATIPLSFKDKGLQYCDFKVSFDPLFVKEVTRRLKEGWTIKDFIEKCATPTGIPNDYEISRVIINDDFLVDCHAAAKPEWEASAGDVDTACPASIIAQMIAEGVITERGVLPPETVVPINHFFKELEKRHMLIKLSRH